MDTNEVYFVDFYKYCKKCKFEHIDDKHEPCNECLTVAGRPGTRVPLNYKEDKK